MLRVRLFFALTLVVAFAGTSIIVGQQADAPASQLVGVLLAGIQGASVPRVKTRALPTYPAAARGKGIAGTADVEVVVGTNGRVVDARPALASSADDLGFLQSTLEAARDWTFSPAVEDRRPVPSLVVLHATFPKSSTPDDVPTVAADMTTVPHISAAADDRSTLPLRAYPTKTPGLTQPRLARSVQPRYTPSAMRSLVQGDVEMEILILTNGTVGDARILRSLDPELDNEAQVAARYWRFIPGAFNGEPVPVLATLILSFRLH